MSVIMFKDGKSVTVKDALKTDAMLADGYKFSDEEEAVKLLTKPQTMKALTEAGIEFDKTAPVAELRALLPVEEDKSED